MSIRRHTYGGLAGYGVLGTDYTATIDLINVSLANEASKAWNLYKGLGQTGGFDVFGFVFMQWRLSFQLFSFTSAKLQQYNSKISKYRLGTVLFTAYGYVTGEEFLSFATQKCSTQRCVFKFIGDGGPDEDIPCDEPQIDSPSLYFGSGDAAFYGFNAPSDVASLPTWSSEYSGNIADSAIVAIEPSVNAFGLGITYVYKIYGYDESGAEGANNPPVVIV